MNEPLRRAEEPPPKGPRDWIYRVRPGAGFKGQIYSNAVWGVMTHWDGDRTRECTDGQKKCQRCIDGQPSRYRGYLHVWNAVALEEQFLELTGDAVEELWRQVGKGKSLRGITIEVTRHGKSIRGKIIVKTGQPSGDVSRLSEEKDPEETLRKLWNWVKYS